MKRAAFKSSSIVALAVLACAALLPGIVRSGTIAKVQVEKVLRGDLAGDGRVLEVRFYTRGPIPVVNAATESPYRRRHRPVPPDYVRGVTVAEPRGPVLDRWEAQPGSILLWQQLSGLWPVPPRGMLITLAAQYGAKVSGLWALRWNGQKLSQVGEVAGQISIQQISGRLVVRQEGNDYDIPSLYAWNGSALVEASSQFPQYYATLGASELQCLSQAPIRLGGFTDCCQRALHAFSLAGMVDAGIKACTEAKERIAGGAEIVPESERETPEYIAKARPYVIARIDELLAKNQKTVAVPVDCSKVMDQWNRRENTSLTEVANDLHISRASVRRCLKKAVTQGGAEASPGGATASPGAEASPGGAMRLQPVGPMSGGPSLRQ